MDNKTALISVSNKEGVIEFAKGLSKLNYKILSTGGTSKLLKKNNIEVTDISEYTGQEEILDGRVKTLHPKIFAGILATSNHFSELNKLNIQKIDLVAVNLYPFEQTVKNNASLKETIENIDIGGHTLIRASSKNYKEVTIVIDPEDYQEVLQKLKNNSLDEKQKELLASKALSFATFYDSIISNYFNNLSDIQFPEIYNSTYKKIQDLRYGENPHQKAAYYQSDLNEASVGNAKQLQGKQLSYNNILDANEAFELIKEFKDPAAAVIKHTNPSGVATAQSISQAYEKAHANDPLSAFGCIVALNRPCNIETVKLMEKHFIEVLICPKIEKDALKLLEKKGKLRILETGPIKEKIPTLESRSVIGGMLIQTREDFTLKEKDLEVVTKRKPTKAEIQDMIFAFKVSKHTKSNSIVFAKDNVTTGIGAGQMSRVDAVKLAQMKSNGKCKDSVMSSDAFFPFRDGIDEAAKAGITAIIQPGGSIRDEEAIQAADEHNLAMVFSKIRLFKH